MAASAEGVISALDQVLLETGLSTGIRDRGSRLLARLRAPVRIGIFGLPDSGKGHVLNALIGRQLIGRDRTLPSIELSFGDEAQTILTLEDGTDHIRPGLPTEDLLDLAPVFARVRAPIPVLRQITLLETVTDNTAEDIAAALRWAARRTDISLWCSRQYSAQERDIWMSAPDTLRDHAFLVLTSAEPPLTGATAALFQRQVPVGFQGVFPIAAREVDAALDPDGVSNPQAWNDCGAQSLTRSLLRAVETGREADLDSALLFLNRVAPSLAAALTARPEEPETTQDARGPDGQGTPHAPDANLSATSLPDGAVDRIAGAFQYLRRRARDLLHQTSDPLEDWPAVALAHCAETTVRLSEIFADTESDDEALHDLRQTVIEAADLAVLLQLEGGESQAIDAATVLVQLREDFEAKLAA